MVEVSPVGQHGIALADAIEAALPHWVRRSVTLGLRRAGRTMDGPLEAGVEAAGRQAAVEVGAQVRSLLATDIDDQRSTPLSLVRSAVRYPNEVLAGAGVDPPTRDETQARLLPEDVYELAPATFADIDPSVGGLGITWGAAKAYEHLRRRSSESEGERN